MDLSKEVIERLKKICRTKEEITINGVNGLGETFTTTGRIAIDDKGIPAVHSNGLYVEFGQTKHKPTSKQTDYLAPFMVNYEDSFEGARLYALEIKTASGEVVYTNPDEKEIVYKSTEKQKELKENDYYRVVPQDMDDPVTAKLRAMVGKPISIDGMAGVLACVGLCNDFGGYIISLLNGPLLGALSVDADSELITESNTGEKTILAKNDKDECSLTFGLRCDYMEELKASEAGE